MAKATFDVTKMYADHHVQAARNALLQLDGVEDITASSAFKRIIVRYDPKKATPDELEHALRGAGYAPGEEMELSPALEGKEDGSPWFQLIPRVSSTNMLDLEMSGDHRKY